MDRLRIPLQLLLAGVACGIPAQAYYHYVHYLNGNLGAPVYERFDLNALPDRTVTFFVVDTGPQTYGPNDDFSSVLSQVQQAAIAWNSVSSSALRVAFGGLESQNQTENTPGGDVVFAELPPGLLGLGGTNVPASETPVNGPNGPFFPIARSIIQLTNDTSQGPGPSYLQSFFTTAVHEMGHALGLQHTWTSAAMSQDVIRNTSRQRPIDADDRASLSLLYGAANWAAGFGSISGRVTANGQPVALASVVAIPPAGPAVSTLTNPDGTYTIRGLPTNNYLLYVHPLPPDAIAPNNAGLRLPVDQNGNTLQPSGPFYTVFYPDPNNAGQPGSFSIQPGTAITGQNFSVTPESAVSMYDMVTWSWSGNQSISPAYVNSTAAQFTIEAEPAIGLQLQVPQSVTILGGFGTATLCAPQNATLPCFQAYDVNTNQVLPANTTDSSAALAIYFNGSLAQAAGPRHLVFTLANGDLYVLPDGVNLVNQGPPTIGSITQNGNGSATVTGSNFSSSSTVYFDGEPATVTRTGSFTGTSAHGSITVTPPSGYSGQNASVIVYNTDGQNSTFYQSQNPPTYSYPTIGTPQITVNPTTLPSGLSSMVDIQATNMQFVPGPVTVGMGSSDVSIRRVWVLSPTHLVANLVASPNAAVGSSEISVISGFQVASQPGGFQTQAANLALPFVGLPIANANPNQAALYPGASASIYGLRLSTGPNTTQVFLNGQAVPVLYSSATQVNFLIPASISTGYASLTLNSGQATSPTVWIEIDNAPAVIQQIANSSGQVLNSSVTAAPGQVLIAILSNIDPTVVNDPTRVQVTISGLPVTVLSVLPGSQSGTVTVSFLVSQSFGGASVPVVVSVDSAPSSPYPVIVQ
ncbi:MAG TPA: IPT/TIG domain-containing protein [Bryobacteraceae bacterium]